MAHQKRFAAPRTWLIERKTKPWVVASRPGAHSREYSLPLAVVLRDLLGYTRTLREAKKLLNQGKIFVNGKARKDHGFATGLFDVISMPAAGEHYVVLLSKNRKLFLGKISEKEAKTKISSIVNKTVLKGGIMQLNLHDGRNMLVKEKKNDYSTKDSLLVDLEKNEVAAHLKYEIGAVAFILRGSHAGEVARIKDIIKIKSSLPNLVELESEGVRFRTSEDSIIIVGKEKPVLSALEQSVEGDK